MKCFGLLKIGDLNNETVLVSNVYIVEPYCIRSDQRRM